MLKGKSAGKKSDIYGGYVKIGQTFSSKVHWICPCLQVIVCESGVCVQSECCGKNYLYCLRATVYRFLPRVLLSQGIEVYTKLSEV